MWLKLTTGHFLKKISTSLDLSWVFTEFRALLHFCENPGKIQTRADLLKKMTGRELKPHDRTVDVTIRRIRKHFESVTDTPEIIATIHGEGYRFCGDLEEL